MQENRPGRSSWKWAPALLAGIFILFILIVAPGSLFKGPGTTHAQKNERTVQKATKARRPRRELGPVVDSGREKLSLTGKQAVDYLRAEGLLPVQAEVCSPMFFTPQAKVTADDGATGDNLGFSIALDGDTLVIGAPEAAITPPESKPGRRGPEITANLEQGAAYVYVRNGGVWTQQQKLVANDGLAGDVFGWAVAVSGNTAIVSARNKQVSGNDREGIAYVFQRTGTNWDQLFELTSQLTNGTDDGVTDEMFGASVAIDGNTAVVGAPQATNENAEAQAGAVYVYLRTGTIWNIQQKLVAANDPGFPGDPLASPAQTGDNLGTSVSISGNNLVAGGDNFAKILAGPVTTHPGAVIAYSRSGVTWTEVQKIYEATPNVAYDGNDNDQFGFAVSISGTTFVASAIDQNAGQGAAYVYVLNGGVWTPQQKLTASDGQPNDAFGTSVSISGDTLVAGTLPAPVSSDVASGLQAAAAGQGAVYAYARSSATWSQLQKVTPSDGVPGDSFGEASSISGNTLAVGAPDATIGGNLNQGAGYIFLRNNAPILTPTTLARVRGTAGSVSTIATVSDDRDAAGSLQVTTMTVPTGISVTAITNNNGTITANVAADCTAAVGPDTVVLQVTDSNCVTTTANLVINVTAPPLSITCPANIIAGFNQECATAFYQTPVANDICPAQVLCDHPSGSCFLPGTTTVTCTASDTADNTASCSFTVNVFNFIIVDDITGQTLVFNSSGAYALYDCRKSTTPIATGTGSFTTTAVGNPFCKNNLVAGVGRNSTQSVNAVVNSCTKVGSATIFAGGKTYILNDANVTNDTFNCISTPK